MAADLSRPGIKAAAAQYNVRSCWLGGPPTFKKKIKKIYTDPVFPVSSPEKKICFNGVILLREGVCPALFSDLK